MPFRRPPCAALALLLPLLLPGTRAAGLFAQVQFYPPAQGVVTQPNPNAKRYTVTGSVFNSVTGEPIGRALVRLNGGPEQRVAFTGADGRFEIANVPEGGVFLSAERPGYFDPRSTPDGSSRSFRGQAVGEGNNDFRLYLIPESKIVGTVLDADGEPVEGVSVQLMGQQIAQGRSQWLSRGGGQTDENGAFRLDGQMPGQYKVCTMAKPLDPFARNSGDAYPGRCYPNSPDAESAQAIDVQSGQTARADFSLELVRAYNISGVVTGSCAGQIQAYIHGANTPGFTQFVRTNPSNGRFVAHSVTSGTWKLTFQCIGGNGMTQTTQEVAVSGADVTGLQVAMQPPIEIPVQVVTPPAQSAGSAPNGVVGMPMLQQLRLIPTDPEAGEQEYYMNQTSNQNGEQAAQPTRVVQNVSPGSYNVVASASGGCLASISYGGTDVSREPLTIAAGAGAEPIVVTLRNDCASLNVTVQADRKDEEANVLVVSDQPFIEPQQLGTQAGASTSLGSLTPGTYRVYAVSNVAGLAYADAQAMRDIPSQTVTLDANAKSDVTVQLYERGKK